MQSATEVKIAASTENDKTLARLTLLLSLHLQSEAMTERVQAEAPDEAATAIDAESKT